MNNWHIKIADCNEAQKEVLKRVHGNGFANFSFLAGSENLIRPVPTLFVKSELITPDEAFERLGLNHYAVNQKLSKQIVEAEQKIKELTQQLAAKSELQRIDWTLVDSDFTHLVQDKKTGGSRLLCAGYYSDHKDCYHLIATRPKPKYTSERIDSACELYSDYVAQLSSRGQNTMTFPEWLKEVGKQ